MKKDGGLRRGVDIRAFNRGSVKNQLYLPPIPETLNRLRGVQIIMRLDLWNAHHLIQIKEGDKNQTVFRTCYGQFEYQVMLFGWTTYSPVTLQDYMDDCLWPLIDNFAVSYIDDILIYLTNEEEKNEQVQIVLELLRELGIYANAEKCHFGVTKFGFLIVVIRPDGNSMQSNRITTIKDWPTPESVREMRLLLGFTNVDQWGIKEYAKDTTTISDLLKRQETYKTANQLNWEWTRDTKLLFHKFK